MDMDHGAAKSPPKKRHKKQQQSQPSPTAAAAAPATTTTTTTCDNKENTASAAVYQKYDAQVRSEFSQLGNPALLIRIVHLKDFCLPKDLGQHVKFKIQFPENPGEGTTGMATATVSADNTKIICMFVECVVYIREDIVEPKSIDNGGNGGGGYSFVVDTALFRDPIETHMHGYMLVMGVTENKIQMFFKNVVNDPDSIASMYTLTQFNDSEVNDEFNIVPLEFRYLVLLPSKMAQSIFKSLKKQPDQEFVEISIHLDELSQVSYILFKSVSSSAAASIMDTQTWMRCEITQVKDSMDHLMLEDSGYVEDSMISVSEVIRAPHCDVYPDFNGMTNLYRAQFYISHIDSFLQNTRGKNNICFYLSTGMPLMMQINYTPNSWTRAILAHRMLDEDE